MEDYTDKVMQHFMHPHNVGYIENSEGRIRKLNKEEIAGFK